jgi:hypothetical protein
MTDLRYIRLPLASDTTEAHCGACKWLVPAVDFDNECGRDPWCVASVFDVSDCLEGHATPERHRECIAAEQAHAALTRDAEAWRRLVAILPRNAQGEAKEAQADLLTSIANSSKRTHAARILDAIAAELRGGK